MRQSSYRKDLNSRAISANVMLHLVECIAQFGKKKQQLFLFSPNYLDGLCTGTWNLDLKFYIPHNHELSLNCVLLHFDVKLTINHCE